ncbi:MAG: hypothetical protein ACJ8LG_13400 [Massilia sp.]
MPSAICFSLADLPRRFVRQPLAAGAPADAVRGRPGASAVPARPGRRSVHARPLVFPMF